MHLEEEVVVVEVVGLLNRRQEEEEVVVEVEVDLNKVERQLFVLECAV